MSLDINELRGFCSDGARVMTGRNGGVAAKFECNGCETMLSIHCICHRLALACGDTGDELTFINTFELTMIQLWSFFKNSAKRLQIYIKTAMKLKHFEGLPQSEQTMVVKRVKKACRTRWLSLHASVDSVYSQLNGILHSLRIMQDERTAGGASAKGLLQKMDSSSFLAVLYMLNERR